MTKPMGKENPSISLFQQIVRDQAFILRVRSFSFISLSWQAEGKWKVGKMRWHRKVMGDGEGLKGLAQGT